MRIGLLHKGDNIMLALWVRFARGRVAFVNFGMMPAAAFARTRRWTNL